MEKRAIASAATSTIAPLGEVEHPGGLEDEHEAQGHQRLQHAGHQAPIMVR